MNPEFEHSTDRMAMATSYIFMAELIEEEDGRFRAAGVIQRGYCGRALLA